MIAGYFKNNLCLEYMGLMLMDRSDGNYDIYLNKQTDNAIYITNFYL
jgi:hypothetical protein